MMQVEYFQSDFRCVHCGTPLKVEDPDDLESCRPMTREEEVWMTCTRCENDMLVHVTWEPTYWEPRK
jgi:primosomal protein N'